MEARVNTLVSRQLSSTSEALMSPEITELCQLIREDQGTYVLEAIKGILKGGLPVVQMRVLLLLEGCVRNSPPSFIVLLSSERWTEKLFRCAKTTTSVAVRDRIMLLVTEWNHTYQTKGMAALVSRMENSKVLGDPYQMTKAQFISLLEERDRKKREEALARQQQQQQQRQRQQNLQRTTTTTATAYGSPDRHSSPTASPTYIDPEQEPRGMSSQLENFLLAAQSDIAVLEYTLEHVDGPLADKDIIVDCIKHRQRTNKLLEHHQDPQVRQTLLSMCERFQELFGFYVAVFPEDAERFGVTAHMAGASSAPQEMPTAATAQSRQNSSQVVAPTAPAAAAVSSPTLQRTGSAAMNQSASFTEKKMHIHSDDEEDDDDGKPAQNLGHSRSFAGTTDALPRQVSEAVAKDSEMEKLYLAEREETKQLREQIAKLKEELDGANQSTQKHKEKYQDAKSKITQAKELMEEVMNERDQALADLEASRNALASKTNEPPPQPKVIEKVVEKIVVQKPKIPSALADKVRSSCSSLKKLTEQMRAVAREGGKDNEADATMCRSRLTTLLSAFETERDEAVLLYRREQKLRKFYYNQVQELKGNIRVYCRVRPFSAKEKSEGYDDITGFPSDEEVSVIDDRGKQHTFEFDSVFKQTSTQTQVFEDTAALIDSVVDGYNVCIFAYGQTGTGKTYTMAGPDEDPGINSRALQRLFKIIEERKDTEESTVSVSIIEIYNDNIHDLLVARKEALKKSHDHKIRQGDFGQYITDVTDQAVASPDEIAGLVQKAQSHRSEASTNMNLHSSRSHMIINLLIRTTNKHTNANSYGKLSLIDLAGSEKLDKSGVEGVGAKEAIAINRSLTALGDVISGLGSGAKHVSFRNNILTQVLQDSMSGQAKVLMFCCVSPASYNASESMSSLRFASRAKGVSLGPIKKNVK